MHGVSVPTMVDPVLPTHATSIEAVKLCQTGQDPGVLTHPGILASVHGPSDKAMPSTSYFCPSP
jgi:hypothetical protein